MRIIYLLAACVAIFCVTPAFAVTEAKSISYPAVSADGQTVYFTYWGDIWAAPRDGGSPARRLTNNVAYDARPMPSPDGKWIAFLSDRFGNYDIFVMPAEGGVARRLTWDSTTDYLYDWKPDGSAILEYCQRGEDLWGYSLWEVPLNGGQPMRISGPDHDGHVFASYLGNANEIVYVRDPGNWARKHYRGSYNHDLWKLDLATGTHTELTSFNGKDLWPQPSPDGKTVYFVSDRDGSENLWKLDIDGGKPQQVSFFKGDGPRWPRISSDGDEIACDVFGELYLVPTAGGRAHKVPLYIAEDPKHEMSFDSKVSNEVSEFVVSPNGNYFALAIYGDIYLLKNPDSYEDDDKPDQDLSNAHQLTDTPQHEMQIAWHPDSTKLAYLSDRDGQFDVFTLDLVTLEEKQITSTPVDEWEPTFSPHFEKLAYYSGSRELMIYSLDDETESVFHEGTIRAFARSNGYEWSPDACWIAYGEYVRDDLTDVWIGNIESGEKYNVSNNPNWNGGITWSADGKYLAWEREAYYYEEPEQGSNVMLLELSPEEETYDFELLFPDDIPVDEDEEEEGDDEEEAEENGEAESDEDLEGDDGEEAGDAEESEDDEGEEEDDEVEPIKIKLEDIAERAYSITNMDGSAGSPMFAPDGDYLVFYTSHSGESEIWSVSLDETEYNKLTSASDKSGWEFSDDGGRLYYLQGGSLSYLEMSGAKSTGGGSVAVSSQVAYDQHEVWDQVLVEGWRYLRDYFYDKGMHGIDWDEVLSRYRPRLQYIGTTTEFTALYREMLGEINSSHMGFSSPGNEREAPSESTGDLGVYFEAGYDGSGWKVAHVIKDGPATKPGSELYPGDVILEVGGTSIDGDDNRAQLLRNKVGKPIQLTVESAEPDEDGETLRTVAIKPTSTRGLRTLKYNEWVEANREMVAGLSGGKLYYQHIRSMNHSSLVTFRDELFTEALNYQGLVLDVRFNGGGFTSVAVMELLARRGAYLRRRRDGGETYYARQQVFEGPLVLLINAHSFSNAEILAHVLKDAGLATIIGEATGGNVISTGGIYLLDGSRLSMPGYRNDRITGDNMEGGGAQPDIVVIIDPNLLAEGRDNQIEAAVEHLLGEVE